MAMLLALSAPSGQAGQLTNFFTKGYAGSRSNFTGNVGYEFVPVASMRILALGRSVSGAKLTRNHDVAVWDAGSRLSLARVTVSPASQVDAQGFAFELLARPVALEGGRPYRITSFEEAGGDPFVDITEIPDHLDVAAIGAGAYAVGDAYPATRYGNRQQGYGVPTFYFDRAPLALKPFIRDVTTGYLLQYSFMSPRPYCWQGGDCLLSGWEVERSGGHFEFHPTCRYPGGFAFHSDWFKLVDTSTNTAITLKHRIARQTDGPLTLEFRFKLPSRMDGACWQLRDLETDAVSLVMAGGNLCWEPGTVLSPCETNREYGVKVVADITAGKADVYVDGELKANDAPFLHPVKTLDYFLVKTGDAATGEMFLNPVNVHKGYAVNETFVTCGAGKMPADWAVSSNGGTATVESFECSTKPDIYSLKMQGGSTGGTAIAYVSTARPFPPLTGRTVLEYRFLLPGKGTGFSVGLGAKGAEGLRIGTTATDLNLVGCPQPLVRGYRTNLWYMVKVVADPKGHVADVFVNGKQVARSVPIDSRIQSFEAVNFGLMGGGIAWIDDVQVYPWRDVPADYVPEPRPVKASHLLGVQSCNLWREGTAYAGWDYVLPCRDKREPYLGWYDEGNPEETDWEIKWQVEHGITFEQHCWYRPNNAINHPIKDGVLDQGIVKGLFNARYGHLKKFTIMCTDEGACETNPQDWRENIIPYWIEYFFKDPRYFTLDGKPVLSIYHLGNWLRMFGGTEGARAAIRVLRDEVAQAGFPGLIVLMEHRGADRKVLQTMKEIGVDSCYAYTWGTPDVKAQRQKNVAQRDAAAAAGLGMLPSISMGWDREAWGARDGGWATVGDYQALARWARDEFIPGLPAASPGRRIVMLANRNEFGEGHFLMPSTLAGFGYLDALREVFTEGGPHQDARPTDEQKRRFTVLYPRE